MDGNKRTAMTAAIVFLRLNGVEPAPDSEKWEKLVLDVASSRLDRDGTTKRLRALLRARRKAKGESSSKTKPILLSKFDFSCFVTGFKVKDALHKSEIVTPANAGVQ